MKKNIEITHVCLAETVYSLMIYMLLVKEEDLKKTFFFVSESLPYSIIKKMSYSHCFHIPQKRYMKWLFRNSCIGHQCSVGHLLSIVEFMVVITICLVQV